MLIVKINNKDYEVASEWRDFTLATAKKVKALEVPAFDNIFDCFDEFEKVISVVELLSNAGKKEIERTHPESVAYLYWEYLHKFVLDLQAPYCEVETELITDFSIGEKRYYLPETLALENEMIFQHNQNARAFVEASDLLKNLNNVSKEGLFAMPLFISCIVKDEPNEIYNEKRVVERAAELEQMDMQTFWNVFFYIVERWNSYNRSTLNYLIGVERAKAVTRIGFIQRLKAALRGAWKRLKNLLSGS